MYILFKRFVSYSAFYSIPYIPYFTIFRVFRHSVPSFRQSAIPLNSVTPYILMSKKILNAGLISVLKLAKNRIC